MERRHSLKDSQWYKIKDLLPGRKETVGAKDNRLFVEAVIYRYKTGIPWRDLPKRFGDFRVVHTRFSRWSGIWEKIFKTLSEDDVDNEYAMIDSTIVLVHGTDAKHSSPE